MKIALVTDTHAGARQESALFDEHFISFFENSFFPYLDQHDIKTVIHLGDVFDRRKYVNFKILDNWNRRVFKRLTQYDTHIILGNHDVYYKNTNSINSVHQLLSPYNFSIYDSAAEVVFDRTPLLFVPWINEENSLHTFELMSTTSAQILLGHLEIKGFSMYAGQVNHDHGLDKATFSKFDLCFSGHFHHKSDDGYIHYLGSPYAMTWADYGDPRGFHIFDTDTRELTFIPFENPIFIKLHYDDSQGIPENPTQDFSGKFVKVVVVEKTNPYAFEKFIESITDQTPGDISIVERIAEHVGDDNEMIDRAKDTLTLLTECVDELTIDCKNDLKTLFRELYTEAADVDVTNG